LYHKPLAVTFAEIERIESLSEAELDRLPFGIIHLDGEGNILSLNQREREATGLSAEGVRGRNFFADVAPCTNVQEFAGRFREGVAAGQLHAVFPYLFEFPGTPRRVWVTLYFSSDNGSAWVFVRDDRE
jgi:photoactive yellow protein